MCYNIFMRDLEKRLADLAAEFTKNYQKLAIEAKLARLAELERAVAEPDLWRDVAAATAKNQELAQLTDETQPWVLLKTNLAELKKALRFQGPHDNKNAVIRITAGAGGTEAMDWAAMLERMYQRFLERKGYKMSEIERVAGEEAGIKTAVYEVTGPNAFGLLKSEHGVHRLVRLSPFNANNLQQTSFALVEILPVIKADTEVEIDEKDLRVDVYHSGGHGGQSVNTTNSAVRITHLPTNTVVAIQNERSQLQNKEKAMEILRGKLAQMQLEQHAATIGELRAGESASWGQQIRNYVLQPYKLVKDTRTGYEETDPEAVLDGKLEGLIEDFLENQG